MVEGGLEGSAVTCCRGARCNPSFRLNTRKEVSCRTIGVTLITQCLLWDCLVLDVCVRVCARSQNGAGAHLMIKDALIPQRFKTKIYNPARLLQKKGGGEKSISTLGTLRVSRKKNPTQCLASVGHSGAALVLLDGQEREMKAVLWKRIKKK